MRLTVKATCPMDLTYFPMDSQLCTLEIESYGYTMDDVVYSWDHQAGSVEVSPDVSLAEFYVVGYRQRRVLEVSKPPGTRSSFLNFYSSQHY